MTKPIVLAFSGGLDTSFCIPWLKERHGAEIVTVTVDTGGLDDAARRALEERAKRLGAREHVLVDAREAFFDETLRYLVMGNVLRGGIYPLCVGAERTLQARKVADDREAPRRPGDRARVHRGRQRSGPLRGRPSHAGARPRGHRSDPGRGLLPRARSEGARRAGASRSRARAPRIR